MQQGIVWGKGDHGQRIILAHGHHPRTFDRINSNVHRRTMPAPQPFTDIQHGGLIDFTFTDHNLPLHGHAAQLLTHGRDGHPINLIFITTAQ
jgi:hypothetical protein